MKLQTWQRVLCCFLICLIILFTVAKPIEAQAVAAAAAASIVGITVESAIPWLLSALSVSYLAASVSELYPKIKAAIKDWIFTKSGTEYINAYIYDNKLCFSSDVLSKVTTVSDTFLLEKYNTNNYSNMIGVDWYDSSNVAYSFICFSDNTPKMAYSESAGAIHVSCYLPAIIFVKVGNKWTFYDESSGTSDTGWVATYSCAAAPTVSDQEGKAITRFVSIAESGTVIDIPAGAPTNSGKDKIYPVIDSTVLTADEVVETGTTAEVNSSESSSTNVSSILGWLEKIWAAIIALANSIVSPITAAISTFQAKVEALWDAATTAITTAIADVIEWLKSLGTSITDILEWLKTLPGLMKQTIVDALTAVFVPEEGYIETEVEALVSACPLVHSVVETADCFTDAFTGFYNEPPIIYAELHNATTSWDIGDRAVILDLRWYATYKPTVDILISAFLLAVFAWRIFQKLPGIISGMPGDFVMESVEAMGMVNELPSRSKTYETRRESLRDSIRKEKGK